MPFDRFFVVYPKYLWYKHVDDFREIYDWMSENENVYRLTLACERGAPALEGIVEELVKLHGNYLTVKFCDRFVRQMIGAAIKEILFDYGYLQTKNYRLSSHINGDPFKSGTHYRFYKSYQTKELVVKIEVSARQLREPIQLTDDVQKQIETKKLKNPNSLSNLTVDAIRYIRKTADVD